MDRKVISRGKFYVSFQGLALRLTVAKIHGLAWLCHWEELHFAFKAKTSRLFDQDGRITTNNRSWVSTTVCVMKPQKEKLF